jgi:hypothetical protein
MSFAFADGPESVAVYEHGVKELLMPCVRFKLGRGVGTVDVILLDGLPGGYDLASYQMAPADGGLVDGKLAVDWWIVGKFGMGGCRNRSTTGCLREEYEQVWGQSCNLLHVYGWIG